MSFGYALAGGLAGLGQGLVDFGKSVKEEALAKKERDQELQDRDDRWKREDYVRHDNRAYEDRVRREGYAREDTKDAEERAATREALGAMYGSSDGSGEGDFFDSIGLTESGHNTRARNKDTDASGTMQFIPARLEDYNRANGTSFTTADVRSMSDAEQRRLEAWHFQDILSNVEKDGLFEQYVGQEVGGVKVTKSGILAMAHLGGYKGAKRFLETGGKYNPSDGNTRLSDYLRTHGGKSIDMSRRYGSLIPADYSDPAAPVDAGSGMRVGPTAERATTGTGLGTAANATSQPKSKADIKDTPSDVLISVAGSQADANVRKLALAELERRNEDPDTSLKSINYYAEPETGRGVLMGVDSKGQLVPVKGPDGQPVYEDQAGNVLSDDEQDQIKEFYTADQKRAEAGAGPEALPSLADIHMEVTRVRLAYRAKGKDISVPQAYKIVKDAWTENEETGRYSFIFKDPILLPDPEATPKVPGDPATPTPPSGFGGATAGSRPPPEPAAPRVSEQPVGPGPQQPMATPGPSTTQPAAPKAPGPKRPRIGDVIDGYEYMGGDPADPTSWRKS